MLSKSVVHACRHGGSERLRKNGHAGNEAQRARCLECGRTFILEPKGPRHDQKFKDQVLPAYQDRMSPSPCSCSPACLGQPVEGHLKVQDTL